MKKGILVIIAMKPQAAQLIMHLEPSNSWSDELGLRDEVYF